MSPDEELRALNRFLAEHAMGYRMDGNNSIGFPRHYSTDPAASDALLDKMTELGWNWEIHGKERFFFAKFAKGRAAGSASMETKHLTIAAACKSALQSERSFVESDAATGTI